VEGISELNKRKVRFFVEAVWNEGRLELIDDLVAADYIGRFSPMSSREVGREELRHLVASRRRACPALLIKIEDQIAEDDRVAIRWQLGTTVADGGRLHARSGYIQRCLGISIIRLLAGKQIDSHTEWTTVANSH
jgi:hypothetical protein